MYFGIFESIYHRTLQVLLHAGLDAQVLNYHDLMKKMWGQRGAELYGVFAFLFAFGGCCAYTVIVGDTVPIVLRAMLGVASLETQDLSFFVRFLTDRRIVIVICSFSIMLPISCIRNVSHLAKFSIFALGAIVLIAICVIWAGSRIEESLQGSSQVFTIIKWNGLSSAIGTLCFAYVCHHNTFIIFRSLEQPTPKNFNMVNMASLGYAMLASLAIGASGYVIFTDKIKSNVLNCFSDTDPIINFARFLFALDMFLTYPLELFIARNTIFRMLLLDPIAISDRFHYAVTLALISCSTFLGVLTCNLGIVLDLTGGIAASGIAFIFPSACRIKLTRGPIIQPSNYSHIVCIAFGFAIMVLTTITTLIEAFEGPPSSQCKFINF